MKQRNNDYRCVLIGDSGVGKNTLFQKLSSHNLCVKNISNI